MFPLSRVLLHLLLEVMDPDLIHSHESLNKTVGFHLKMTRFSHVELSPFQISYK